MPPHSSVPAFRPMRGRTGWGTRKIQTAPFSDSPRPTPPRLQIISNSFSCHANQSPRLKTHKASSCVCQEMHTHASTAARDPARPQLESRLTCFNTGTKGDRHTDLLFSGRGWAEDSFQSSPNSVTETRFRNKILRTLFPFPPHLPTSGCKKPLSTPPPLYSPPARSSGWRCVRGGGGRRGREGRGAGGGSGDGTRASC